jgi:cysteine synthase A
MKFHLPLRLPNPLQQPPQSLLLTTFFLAGVLLTLGFKDIYPDLELRFRRSRRRHYWSWGSLGSVAHSRTLASTGLRKEDEDEEEEEEERTGMREKIGLEDHTRSTPALHDGEEGKEEKEGGNIITGRERGIEACVGNTPLIRIESLSRETGCEIWGKAEVSEGVFWMRAFL